MAGAAVEWTTPSLTDCDALRLLLACRSQLKDFLGYTLAAFLLR